MSAPVSRHVTALIIVVTSLAASPVCLAQPASYQSGFNKDSPNEGGANQPGANKLSVSGLNADQLAAADQFETPGEFTGAAEQSGGQSATSVGSNSATEPSTADDLASPNKSNELKDPWENFNRRVFVFNTFMDDYLLRPIALGYHTIVPDPVETGVSNAFENLLEPANILNDILQWKWKAAGRDLGRVVVNTTAGVGGLWDVATYIGWKNTGGEDFGQTLRVWGLPQGPYIMVPFLGPSTAGDLAAFPVDMATNPVTYLESRRAQNGLTALNVVHKRASFLSSEELITGDKYTFIRDAYLQNREFKTNDGQVEDDFGMGSVDDFGAGE